MDASRIVAPGRIVALAAMLGTLGLSAAEAARTQTPNFVVHARTQQMADEIGRAAEHYRRELAIEWTGQVMPNWHRPCPIHVREGDIGAGGATTFSFDRGEVFGWKMNVQGTMQRILDSVLPHEVSHTIFACHFRRPLPRWADEGAATLVEHEAERRRQTRLLSGVIRTSRRIPLGQLLSMTEYPTNQDDVLTLYAEGYSLADLLVQEKGKTTYLRFLGDAHQGGWAAALSRHYGYRSVGDLEQRWHSWVMAGSPRLDRPAADGAILAGGDSIAPGQFRSDAALAAATSVSRPAPAGARGQTPDHDLASPAIAAGRQPKRSLPPIDRTVSAPRRPQPDEIDLGLPARLAAGPGDRISGDRISGDRYAGGRLPRTGLIEPVYRTEGRRDDGPVAIRPSDRGVFRVGERAGN